MKDPSSGPGFGKAGTQGAIWGRATSQAAQGEAGRAQSQSGASGAELKF